MDIPRSEKLRLHSKSINAASFAKSDKNSDERDDTELDETVDR